MAIYLSLETLSREERSGFIRLYALSVFSQKRILNRQRNLKCPLKVNKSPWVAGTIFLFNNFSFVLSKNFKLFPGYYHPHELLTLDTTTDITTSSTSLIPGFSSDTNNTMVYIYKGGTANIDCEVDNLGKRHINHHILLSHALACEENLKVTCLHFCFFIHCFTWNWERLSGCYLTII